MRKGFSYSRKIIGKALVRWNNESVIRGVVLIDKSRLRQLGLIRVG